MLLTKTLRSATFTRALTWIAVFGAVVVALFAYVYWSTTSYVLGRSDRMIAAERELLRKAYEGGGRAALVAAIERSAAEDRERDGLYLLADPSLTPLAGNLKAWPSEFWPSQLQGSSGWGNFSLRARDPAAADRPLLRARFETLANGDHLLVGRDISDLHAFATRIETALALVISLILVIAAAASISVTRRTVARIESINATSQAIMHSGLGTRIPLHGTRDEWDQLAANLNSMLDRIEALMGEVKQVTDNVAHDLRTPLSRIRGRLEQAGNRRRNAEHDQSLIHDTMVELDGVLRMFASITRISQIETSDRRAAFRPVDLGEVARDVVELFDAAAEENSCHLDLTADRPAMITADRDLLFDAIANLVDNAIKHGGAGGRISVDVAGGDGDAVISVADHGPGIPADEHQHVFKRFYRLERGRSTSGNGLGLSVVAAVARLHGAHIELFDNSPGLGVRLCFAAQARSAA